MGWGMTAAVVLPHGHLCVLVLVPSFSKVRVAKDIAIQMCDVLDGGEYVGMLNAPNVAAARKSKLTPYVSLGGADGGTSGAAAWPGQSMLAYVVVAAAAVKGFSGKVPFNDRAHPTHGAIDTVVDTAVGAALRCKRPLIGVRKHCYGSEPQTINKLGD